MAGRKQLIITFTHSNYCLTSYGTEKFVREYSSLLQEKGFAHLVFFPIAQRGNKCYVGVIYNDKFFGIFYYTQIEQIIAKFVYTEELTPVSINIQHLKGHDIQILTKLILHLKLGVVYFVHDYYSICCNSRLIDSSGRFCGFTMPSMEKCSMCNYIEGAITHNRRISAFLEKINPFLEKIVVPSDFVKKVISSEFLFLSNKICVRPHLILDGVRNRSKVNKPIRIAFAGAQIRDKGYEEWKMLVDQLPRDKYEFYYLGFGKDCIDGVTNISVVGANGGKKMQDWLIEKEIDCAFFWSHCAETYSYVYYELSVAGVYILTNRTSGNVTEAVEANKNGIVFFDIDECIRYLTDAENVERDIAYYRKTGDFRPLSAEPNSEVMVTRRINSNVSLPKGNKCKKNMFMSALYVLKHIIFSKGERNIWEILDRRKG